MGDTRITIGLALVVLAALIAFIGLLALGLTRPAGSRAGLVAGGLPLALLPAIAGVAVAAWGHDRLFDGMSNTAGSSARTLEPLSSLWMIPRVGFGAFALLCLVGLIAGLLPSRAAAGGVPCSLRRGAFLLALPCLALLVSGAMTHRMTKGFRAATAVLSDAGDPASRQRTTIVLEGLGLRTEGPGSLSALSGFVARTSTLGVFGSVAIVVILLGLAVSGSILGWRIAFGGTFTTLAALLWLLAAALAGLVALGVPDPARLP